MNQRRLGRTGLEVSEVGLGTWALGSTVYGSVEADAPRRAVREALDAGIDFFDTAPLYGSRSEDGVAETLLGEALGDRRNEVVIATKFGRTSTDVMPGRFHAEEARVSVEASLRRLGRETIDLLFFHSPFTPEEIHDDVWEALAALRSVGKVRFLGHSVSRYQDTSGMSAEWMRQRRIDVVQLVLSPFNREARPLLAVAREAGCGVVARECLANGFLSGAIRRDTVFPEGSLNARYGREEIAERADYAAALARVMVHPPLETLPEAAYRWVLDEPGVSVALSGAKHPRELDDALRASAQPSFSSLVREQVEALHARDFGAA
jgi:aryl-alcohol dehydrogenase-like predicted oxidoreductase